MTALSGFTFEQKLLKQFDDDCINWQEDDILVKDEEFKINEISEI